MTPYCIESGDIRPDHIEVYDRVCLHLKTEKYDSGNCHTVCAEIAKRFGHRLRHVKGKFAGGWEHSWLEFKDDSLTVIDAYPWACASGPMLITLKHMSPWFGLYREVPYPPLQHPEGGQ